MPDVSDMELLRDYDRQGSETAFAEVVRRHINLVYWVAFRHVGIAAHAEEITQAVFVILARKAAGLRPDTILEGWLHETTRLTALSFLRGERRRQFREQEAYMQSTLQEPAEASAWNQLAPLLDEAMSRLGKKDRDAVMLRFFKDNNVGEVAAALKVTEAAAQRRILRAVEKLRRFFTKRGVVLPAAVLTAAISANSVQAAPALLAKTATAVAITKGAAASGSTLTLIKGALKLMAWTKAKTAIVAGMGVLLAAGTATLAVNELAPHQTPSGNRAEMKIRWQSGKTYAMRAEMVETVESKSSGQPQSFKQSVNLAQDYNLSVRKELDNGGRQLELEFTGETMDVCVGERKVSSFDSKQDSAHDGGVSMSAMLRKQLGARFQFFTDADGQVEKVEGLEELMREIKTIGKPQDQAIFQQMFSGDILKEYVSFGDMMPNRPVTIGDRWRKTKDFASPGGMVATDTEYTFKNRAQHRDRQCMQIGVAGTISAKPDATAQNSPRRNIKGKLTGDAWFDPELGMVVDSTFDQNITMEIMNRGQAVTLQINMNIRFTLVDVE
jgi:RNA polymerase sigma factor (sigma-70 family)